MDTVNTLGMLLPLLLLLVFAVIIGGIIALVLVLTLKPGRKQPGKGPEGK